MQRLEQITLTLSGGVRGGGYRSMGDLLFDWFGFGQTNKSVVH